MNSSSPAINGPSHLFSIPVNMSGRPAAASLDDVSANLSPSDSSSDGSPSTRPSSTAPQPAASKGAYFSKIVEPLTKSISEAISEAIEAVVTPASHRRAGKILTFEEQQARGFREERIDERTGKIETEFFLKVKGRYETIALLIAEKTAEGKVLVEAQEGSDFDTEEEAA